MATKSPKVRRKSTSADPCTQYALDVTEGREVAGPHVRDACKRHLRDLEEGPKRGLKWDVAAAERFWGFCRDVLRLNGGQFEGKPFELLGWQYFVSGSVFGWKAEDGTRRFRTAYIETAKGSGKSPLAAAVGLYCLVADNEPRAEVYAAATKKDQAQILFRDAVAMVEQSPELNSRIQKSGRSPVWNLAYMKTASFFRPIASDDSQSGPRPHCALLDEVHEHKSPLMLEMMRAGTKSRRQALMFEITNSGTDKNSVCWAHHDYAAKLAAGMQEDDAFFGFVCSLDEGDDPLDDESCWGKANPSLAAGIPGIKYLREQVTEAKGMPSKESTVRRLNFCQWVEAANPWIGADAWLSARDADFDEERLIGRKCYAGLDLSSTTDLTAFTLLFEPNDEDPLYRLKAWFWLPEQQLTEKARKDRVPYVAWRAGGWLETTPGSAVDKRAVLSRIIGLSTRYDIREIGFDEWRIEDFISIVNDEGVTLPLVKFRQGTRSMGPAMDEFERLLIGGHMKHDGNPILTWNAASAVAQTAEDGNRKLSKMKATGRIDGMIAGVMAAGRASLARDDSADFDRSIAEPLVH